MPYNIVKNKNNTFSVVNKDTGRRLSKGTTEAKAKKQIKAVYMNGGLMKPSHQVRHFVSLLKDRPIKNKLHRNIVDFSKELLKAEEINGGAWYNDWGDLWSGVKDVLAFPSQIINEIPYVKEGIEMVFPEATPILEFAPKIGKFIYGDDTNVWLTDMLSDIPVLGDIRGDKTYKSSNDLGQTNWFTGQKSDQQLKEDAIRAEQIADEQNRAQEEIYGENDPYTQYLADTLQHIDNITPQQSDTPYTPYEVPLYSGVNKDIYGNVISMDSVLRFPIIYNFENTDQPQTLQDFLISNGVAGKDFCRYEFGNTVKNQQPFAFLDYPINGGNLGKINYKKNCY
jgi:hypothetical protein